jgi:hypothetical protein
LRVVPGLLVLVVGAVVLLLPAAQVAVAVAHEARAPFSPAPVLYEPVAAVAAAAVFALALRRVHHAAAVAVA